MLVDKTRFIEILQKDRLLYPYITRPHYFGKTFFASTLKKYYDVALADQFDHNFRGTYICEHKTELANSLRVLDFDFSHLTLECGAEAYRERVRLGIADFVDRYPNECTQKFVISKCSSIGNLLDDFLIAYGGFNEPHLYVIVDNNTYYRHDYDLLYKEGKKSALLRELHGFFLSLKSGVVNSNIDYVFTTGTKATDVRSEEIDPYPLGFDIVTNISARPHYAAMFGFTKDELLSLIPQVLNLGQLGYSVNEVIKKIRQECEEYLFSFDCDITVFDPSEVITFLQQFPTKYCAHSL